jgi:6-phosphogluconate dehydrogenase
MVSSFFSRSDSGGILTPLIDKGFTVCAYNRTTSKVDNFLENEAKGKFQSIDESKIIVLTLPSVPPSFAI